MSPLFFTHTTGRARSGSDVAGSIVHAVTSQAALCGREPGRKSGWSDHVSEAPDCPKCIDEMKSRLVFLDQRIDADTQAIELARLQAAQAIAQRTTRRAAWRAEQNELQAALDKIAP